MSDTFDLIATQRHAVADALASLDEDEWDRPSLCAGWRVRELAAHLTMPFRVGRVRFGAAVVGAGGNVASVMDRFARSHADEPTSSLVAVLRDHADSHFVAPTLTPVASLTEIVVHGFDAAIPTGRHVEVPEVASRPVLDYLVSKSPGSVFTTRGLARGVRLVSTDSEWSWGVGPEVWGTNFGLIMLLARRPLGVDEVSGPGVDIVRRHLAGR
jgi:uncharacterized protein (TIGR03083 family)